MTTPKRTYYASISNNGCVYFIENGKAMIKNIKSGIELESIIPVELLADNIVKIPLKQCDEKGQLLS